MEEYVSVGLSPDYSITVNTSTYDKGFILFTIIFSICLLIFVSLVFLAANRASQPKRVIPLTSGELKQPNDYTNFGAANFPKYSIANKYKIGLDGSAYTTLQECNNAYNTEWNDNRCTCIAPYFGPRCQLEKHDRRYFSIGIIDESDVGLTIINKTHADGKSFGENSCSRLCDKNKECDGFIYNENNQCTLIKGDVIIPKNNNISYSLDNNANLYMKNVANVKFDDVIFIASNEKAFNGRYWMINKNNIMAQIVPYEVVEIDFYPKYIRINTEKTGIYCIHKFLSGDIYDIFTNSEHTDCYIHHPGTPLNVPQIFNGTKLYVTYI